MDQFNWKSFVYNVNSRSLIPIIGNDLSFVRISKAILSKSPSYEAYQKAGFEEGNDIRINLYKYLAIRLWDTQEEGPIKVAANINSVALYLMENKVLDGPLMGVIKNEIASLTPEQIILDPYLQLIKINGFETFVTVNYDNFLERAFELEGKKINKPINLSLPPFPSLNLNDKKDPALPRIYNLMGSIKENSFAFTDELSLEYLYMLQNGTNTIAKELYDLIFHKSILLVGSSYPDWFMRFFIRIISNERLRASTSSKYVACDSAVHESELKYFLENNATQVIPIDAQATSNDPNTKIYKNSIEFINEMYEQCGMSADVKKDEVRYKELAFISYSWTDKSLAERIKNEFERNGVNVWFDDEELKTGERYNQSIKKYLKECDFFVALISNNSISDQTRYVYDKEWKFALFFNDERQYVRPYIIDNTEPGDPRIPEEMRQLNIEKMNNFDLLGEVVRKFIQENNLTKISA